MLLGKKSALSAVMLGSFVLQGCGGSTVKKDWEIQTDFGNSQSVVHYEVKDIDKDLDGDWVAVTNHTLENGFGVQKDEYVGIVKYSASGVLRYSVFDNLIAANALTASTHINDAEIDTDGSVYIAGTNTQTSSDNSQDTKRILAKWDQNGALVWQIKESMRNGAGKKTGFNAVFIAGNYLYTTEEITRVYDKNTGARLLEITDVASADHFAWDVMTDSKGNIITAGKDYLSKHSASGQLLWKKDFTGNTFVDEVYLALDGNDNVFMSNRYFVYSPNYTNSLTSVRKYASATGDALLGATGFGISEQTDNGASHKPLLSVTSDGRFALVNTANGHTTWAVWNASGGSSYKGQVQYTNPTSLHLDNDGNVYLMAGGYGFKFNNKAELVYTAKPPQTLADTVEGRGIVKGKQFSLATWIGTAEKTWFYASQYTQTN